MNWEGPLDFSTAMLNFGDASAYLNPKDLASFMGVCKSFYRLGFNHFNWYHAVVKEFGYKYENFMMYGGCETWRELYVHAKHFTQNLKKGKYRLSKIQLPEKKPNHQKYEGALALTSDCTLLLYEDGAYLHIYDFNKEHFVASTRIPGERNERTKPCIVASQTRCFLHLNGTVFVLLLSNGHIEKELPIPSSNAQDYALDISIRNEQVAFLTSKKLYIWSCLTLELLYSLTHLEVSSSTSPIPLLFQQEGADLDFIWAGYSERIEREEEIPWSLPTTSCLQKNRKSLHIITWLKGFGKEIHIHDVGTGKRLGVLKEEGQAPILRVRQTPDPANDCEYVLITLDKKRVIRLWGGGRRARESGLILERNIECDALLYPLQTMYTDLENAFRVCFTSEKLLLLVDDVGSENIQLVAYDVDLDAPIRRLRREKRRKEILEKMEKERREDGFERISEMSLCPSVGAGSVIGGEKGGGDKETTFYSCVGEEGRSTIEEEGEKEEERRMHEETPERYSRYPSTMASPSEMRLGQRRAKGKFDHVKSKIDTGLRSVRKNNSIASSPPSPPPSISLTHLPTSLTPPAGNFLSLSPHVTPLSRGCKNSLLVYNSSSPLLSSPTSATPSFPSPQNRSRPQGITPKRHSAISNPLHRISPMTPPHMDSSPSDYFPSPSTYTPTLHCRTDKERVEERTEREAKERKERKEREEFWNVELPTEEYPMLKLVRTINLESSVYFCDILDNTLLGVWKSISSNGEFALSRSHWFVLEDDQLVRNTSSSSPRSNSPYSLNSTCSPLSPLLEQLQLLFIQYFPHKSLWMKQDPLSLSKEFPDVFRSKKYPCVFLSNIEIIEQIVHTLKNPSLPRVYPHNALLQQLNERERELVQERENLKNMVHSLFLVVGLRSISRGRPSQLEETYGDLGILNDLDDLTPEEPTMANALPSSVWEVLERIEDERRREERTDRRRTDHRTFRREQRGEVNKEFERKIPALCRLRKFFEKCLDDIVTTKTKTSRTCVTLNNRADTWCLLDWKSVIVHEDYLMVYDFCPAVRHTPFFSQWNARIRRLSREELSEERRGEGRGVERRGERRREDGTIELRRYVKGGEKKVIHLLDRIPFSEAQYFKHCINLNNSYHRQQLLNVLNNSSGVLLGANPGAVPGGAVSTSTSPQLSPPRRLREKKFFRAFCENFSDYSIVPQFNVISSLRPNQYPLF